jgi:predicted acetyltransferase
VDSTGELKGGPQLSGLPGLKKYLITEKRDAFLHQMAQKSLGFALGRSLDYYDESVIRKAVADLKENDHRFSALITAIVKSYPFRYRREKGYLAHAK